MKFSYNILKSYFKKLPPPEKLAELINLHITEVEGVEYPAKNKGVLVSKILEIKKHPQADKLTIVRVDAGKKEISVVCGASNIFKGMVAPLVLPGTTLPNGLKVEPREIRGIRSEGMLASASELGIGNDASGILELPPNLKIGSPFTLGGSEVLLNLKVLSNRPEYLSYWGLAREIGIVMGEKPRLPQVALPRERRAELKKRFRLKVDGRYAATYLGKFISGIKIGASPDWLRNTIEASGFKPVNNVVDLANLVMLETGQPLHTFDADEIRGQLEVRLSRKGEKIITLDETKLILPAGVLLIADQRGPIALAGVVGGLASGLSSKTKALLLEAATFDPRVIRLGSKKVGIRTDASLRFERGLAPSLPEVALQRFLTLLPKVVPGAVVHKGLLDFRKKLPAPRKILFSLTELNGLVGTNIPLSEIKKTLTALGFKVIIRGKRLDITPPASRLDVKEMPDVAEEALRFWGLKRVKPKLDLRIKRAPLVNWHFEWAERVRKLLLAFGFDEVYTRAITNPALYRRFSPDQQLIEVANPLSSEHSVLRARIWPNLLELLRHNREEEEIALFELGAVFGLGGKEVPPQPWHLAGAVAGRDREGSFRRAKGAVERLIELFGLTPRFQEGKKEGFEIKLESFLGRSKVGSIGLMAPAWAAKVERENVALFELDFDLLVAKAETVFTAEPLPKFPPIKFDIAVVVDEKIEAEQINRLIRQSANSLLEGLELFDVFRGAPLLQGKKSLAYHLVLRSGERTLTDEDRERVEAAIKRALRGIKGEVRG